MQIRYSFTTKTKQTHTCKPFLTRMSYPTTVKPHHRQPTNKNNLQFIRCYHSIVSVKHKMIAYIDALKQILHPHTIILPHLIIRQSSDRPPLRSHFLCLSKRSIITTDKDGHILIPKRIMTKFKADLSLFAHISRG